MGCLAGLIALAVPRLVLAFLWLFTNYLTRGFHSFVWPLLGFFFLPTTTICWAIAQNDLNGVRGWGFLLVVLGVLLDAGMLGGSRRRRRHADRN
jgi:hypothetical protein